MAAIDSSKETLSPDKNALPSHVGIIMDGNGRWAVRQSLPRTSGHEKGVRRAKEIVKAASDLGIKYLTLYIFSTENWKRTEQETGFLMALIHEHLKQELLFYKDNQIRLKLLGDIDGLPSQIQKDIKEAIEDTENFTGLTLCMAINYGGQNEIVRSVKKLVQSGTAPEDITEEKIANNFDVPELPPCDVLIRTGGEKRLSNFLLWHSAYAELIFTDTLWPDYTQEELYKNIVEFQKRTRRFGAA